MALTTMLPTTSLSGLHIHTVVFVVRYTVMMFYTPYVARSVFSGI